MVVEEENGIVVGDTDGGQGVRSAGSHSQEERRYLLAALVVSLRWFSEQGSGTWTSRGSPVVQ